MYNEQFGAYVRIYGYISMAATYRLSESFVTIGYSYNIALFVVCLT